MDRSFHGDGDDVMLVDDFVLINLGSSCHGTTINETPKITHADFADKLPQKPTCLSAETIGEIPSTEPSSPTDSMQQQHQAPTAPDLNAKNPSVSTTPLADKSILDMFEMIEKAAILYSLYQNYADKLAAEFLSLMTHEGLQPQQKQTMFQQQQQQLEKHHLLLQQKISPSQLSNITNAINLQLRNGSITLAQADAMAAKLKMLHNQTRMLEGAQSGIAGMTAIGPMLEGDQSESGISDKTAIGRMLVGDKSGVTGLTATGQVLEGAGQMLRNSPSSYMKQQQQPQNIILQLRIQQQEQQEQLKQQQKLQLKQHQQQLLKYQEHQQQRQMERQLLYQLSQQLRQQQIGFPLQAVVSSPPVGSPTANQSRLSQQMSSQLQQFGQQKSIQQTAKSHQLSSGLTPQVNDVASNTMVTPASPQSNSHSSSNLVHRKLSNKLHELRFDATSQ